ncbi:hypothetical protein, partial [Photobacterium sp.]|uniref:hypothetical protein n=1 Tax=Photobacterium sp. TaxID=660 RepID=UPI00299E8967
MGNETKRMLAMGERMEQDGVETVAMAPLPANSGYAPGNVQGLLKRKNATYIDLKTSGGEAFGAKIYLLGNLLAVLGGLYFIIWSILDSGFGGGIGVWAGVGMPMILVVYFANRQLEEETKRNAPLRCHRERRELIFNVQTSDHEIPYFFWSPGIFICASMGWFVLMMSISSIFLFHDGPKPPPDYWLSSVIITIAIAIAFGTYPLKKFITYRRQLKRCKVKYEQVAVPWDKVGVEYQSASAASTSGLHDYQFLSFLAPDANDETLAVASVNFPVHSMAEAYSGYELVRTFMDQGEAGLEGIDPFERVPYDFDAQIKLRKKAYDPITYAVWRFGNWLSLNHWAQSFMERHNETLPQAVLNTPKLVEWSKPLPK